MLIFTILKSLSILIALTNLVNGNKNFNLEKFAKTWNVVKYEKAGIVFPDGVAKCMILKINEPKPPEREIVAELHFALGTDTTATSKTFTIKDAKTTKDYALESTNTLVDTTAGTLKLLYYSSESMLLSWNANSSSDKIDLVLSQHKDLKTTREKEITILTGGTPVASTKVGECDPVSPPPPNTDLYMITGNYVVVGVDDASHQLSKYKLWSIEIGKFSSEKYECKSKFFDVDKSEDIVQKFQIELEKTAAKKQIFKITTTGEPDAKEYYALRIDILTADLIYWKIYTDAAATVHYGSIFLKQSRELSSGDEKLMKELSPFFKLISHVEETKKSEEETTTTTEKTTSANKGLSIATSTTVPKHENNAAHPSNMLNQSILFSLLITLIPFCTSLMILYIQNY